MQSGNLGSRTRMVRGALVGVLGSVALASAVVPASAQEDITIYHTVRMDLRDDADLQEVERVLGLMEELGNKLDVVQHFIVGDDLSQDFDISATYAISGLEGYRTYLFDPVHLEIDKGGLPLVENMISYDVTDAEDPEAVGQQIGAIHQERIETIPELAELLGQMENYQDNSGQ